MTRKLTGFIRSLRIVGPHSLLVVLGFAVFFVLFFSPVIFSDRVLAPGDGITYFLPNFYERSMLWDPSIWIGFPAAGDAPRMFWYPPAILLGLIPHSWNLFIICAYVLSSSFMYGYVFSLTGSRLAAAVSGLTYGLCGFMIAHLGHAAVVHTTAWLPLIIWSHSQILRYERMSVWWFVIASVAIGCAALAGHPQMFTYSVALAVISVLITGWRTPRTSWRGYFVCCLSIVVGTGLAALQLIPTAELTKHSLRATLTFSEFVAYQLPLRQLPMLLFPYVYGGSPSSFYGTPYFGAWPSSADGWGAGELTGYVGLLPLMLAALGVLGDKRRRLVWFWASVAFVALLFAVGEATPLARITYHLPVLNKFRAPARYLFLFAFPVSVLSGLGVNILAQRHVSARLMYRVIAVAAAILLSCVIALEVFASKINELALQTLNHGISLNFVTNRSIGVPLLIFLCASLVLVVWSKQPVSRTRIGMLLALLVIDLGSFGWFYEWSYRCPYAAYLEQPQAAVFYKTNVTLSHQRILPVRGGTGLVSELPPDLSKLWGIPSASGYGPFILGRLSYLLTMPPHGSVDDEWRQPSNQTLNLLGVRYVVLPEGDIEPATFSDAAGLRWSRADFSQTIGPGCDPANSMSIQIEVPRAERATRLGIIGALACSVDLQQGTSFAEVVIRDSSGRSQVQYLRAGEHVSEWAWDCSDVRPVVQHERAPVFRSYSAERGSVKCEGHDYVAVLTLDSVQEISNVSFRWTAPPGTFALKKLTVIDDERHISRPVHPIRSLDHSSRWRFVGDISYSNSGYGPDVDAEEFGASRVYENLHAHPRAWLVAEARQVTEEDAFTAIRTSRLPDGKRFESRRVALIEESSPLSIQSTTQDGTARVRLIEENIMEVDVFSSAPAFLVTSDTFYPGWKATIDGSPTHIYQTNYLLRGVVVPAGTHLVRFEFKPSSFYYGLAGTGLSLLVILASLLFTIFDHRTSRSR